MKFFNQNRIALILAGIKFILPYLLQHPMYELHRDEMLYLEQGNHLAWGFMEVPPLLSFFAMLTHFLGSGFFWVKFWPSLFGALNVFLVCKMAEEMGGKKIAQLFAGIGLIAGGFLRVNFLFQPNFLEIFFWTLSAYFIIKYINTNKISFIYLLATSLALAWMSKYSVAFFAAGLFAGILLTKHKRLLRSKHTYLAMLLFIAIILPNLLWQYHHNWPVVHHMLELKETQLQFISPVTFLVNQFLMNFPTFFIWIGGLVWLLIFKEGKPYRILAYIYFTVILLLTISNGKDYYSLGTYPMLFAAGGVWLEKVTSTNLIWLRAASIIVILLLFLPLIPVLLPVWPPEKSASYYKTTGLAKTGILKWEDLQQHTLPQDFADMLSWKELGSKVSQVYHSLPKNEKNQTLIYCRNYALAGATLYYGQDLPQVTSDNASFLIWMPDHYNIKHLLFVGRKIPDKDDLVFQQFEKYSVVDSTTTEHAREMGVKIILFENGNEKVNAMIEEGIKQMKSKFER